MKPHRRIRSSPTMSPGLSRPVQGGLTVAAVVLIPLLAIAGSDDLRAAFDFTTGVLTLVSLSAAVVWGLLATDRLFLSVRQRLVGQAIHRTAAFASLGFLLLHATVKVSLGHVELIGARQWSAKSDGFTQQLQVPGVEETQVSREFSGN